MKPHIMEVLNPCNKKEECFLPQGRRDQGSSPSTESSVLRPRRVHTSYSPL